MLFNPVKPVMQIGIDDYGGASGAQSHCPAREITVVRSLPKSTEVRAVPIFKNGDRSSHFLTGENSMVIFRQLGECQVVLPDEDESIQFKIPGFTITCVNIRGLLAVTLICVHNVSDVEAKYPTTMNVAADSTLAKYLFAERVVPLV